MMNQVQIVLLNQLQGHTPLSSGCYPKEHYTWLMNNLKYAFWAINHDKNYWMLAHPELKGVLVCKDDARIFQHQDKIKNEKDTF